MIWFLAYLGVGVFLSLVAFLVDLRLVIQGLPDEEVTWNMVLAEFSTYSVTYDPPNTSDFIGEVGAMWFLWPVYVVFEGWKFLAWVGRKVAKVLFTMMAHLAGKKVTK